MFNIGDQLVAFRKARSLTQDDVVSLLKAEHQLEVTQQTVANWESGTMPRAAALAALGELLNTGDSDLNSSRGGQALTAAQRLDAFRAEMIDMEKRMAELSADFLKLGAYEDAARCAMKADVFKLVVGRVPATPFNE